MKALTNILTRLLMLLLLMLVACTEDTAEVDNLVRGEEYVTVRMQVPGMKAAATRAEDGKITSVTALVFHQDGELNRVVSATDLTATNFKIPRPQSGDIIHFLANVPSDVTIPQSGTQKDVLCGLTTSDDENLSYWGTATYTSGDVINNVTLYRNMAKIEIVAGDECTFPKDRLFIAGLVNANQAGALVPYQDGFNFDLNEHGYYTLPDPATRINKELSEPVNSLYIFEHNNPGTANGLYVICKIDDDYYKVALIGEDGEPYPIIRNHRYVIYVNDLDEGADSFDIAARPETKPCNFEVRDFNESIKAEADKTQLYYDSNDAQVVTVDVTVPNGVSAITIGGAEKFAIVKTAGDGTLNGTTYTMGSGRTATFTFTLNQKNVTEEQVITFSGEDVNATSVTITMAQTPKVTFTNTGAQTLYWNNGSPTIFQVQMNGVPNDKSVTLSITGAAAFTITDANSNELQLDGDNYTYTGGNTTFTIKPKDENSVRDAAYTIGFSGTGNGVNVVPAEVSVTVKASSSALFATSGTINMDNSETSTTITLTKPASVQNVELRITNANGENVNDRFTLSANPSNNVEYNNSIFYIREYNNNTNLSVTFTVKDNAIITSGEYTATFTGNYNGQNITATATITIVKTPSVSFSNTSDKTLYWNNGSPTSFQVQMTGVPDGKNVTLSIANASAFTITDGNGNTVSDTYTGGNTTFTITPKDAGSVNETTAYSITFTDANDSDGVKVPKTPISVKVMNEKPAVTEIVVWQTGDTAFNINEGYTLCSGGGNLGNYQAGATVKVEFNYNIDQEWQKEQMNLTLGTPAGGTYASEKYEEGKANDTLTYIIQDIDVETNKNGWANNIYYSGLKLSGSYVTITKISITPAQ